MRFKFCGDLDCPDWLLAEINTLSNMSSIKTKFLCLQVVKSLTQQEADEEKINKIASDSKFDDEDIKAVIAAISQILLNAVRNRVDSQLLSNELQQLGMPKEHSHVICKCYDENIDLITSHLSSSSSLFPTYVSTKYRIDQILTSDHNLKSPETCVRLEIASKNSKDGKTQLFPVSLSVEKFYLLREELKKGLKILENCS